MHQHVSSSGGGRHSSKPLIGTASGATTNTNSRSTATATATVAMNNAMRDNKSYNDYQYAQSPQIDQNRFNREVSPSPPSLGKLQRQTFFGSSFAGGGVTTANNSNNLPKNNSFSL